MRLLASFVMRGRSQAVMAVSVLAALSWIFPLVGFLSSAAVALVTLRDGAREGMTVALLASAACGGLALLLLGNPMLAALQAVILWLPVWMGAALLRSTRSLASAIQGMLLLGVILIVVQYIQFGDPLEHWRSVLAPFSQFLVQNGVIQEDQRAMVIEAVAPWMTGMLAMAYYLQLAFTLLLARWWQAVLYNPGGFRQEFHQLRLGTVLAYAGLPLGVLALLYSPEGAGLWVKYGALLLMSAYFLQGLALTHGIVAQIGTGTFWLVGIYVLMLLATPHMFMALAVAGYADAWFDFRKRIRARMGG